MGLSQAQKGKFVMSSEKCLNPPFSTPTESAKRALVARAIAQLKELRIDDSPEGSVKVLQQALAAVLVVSDGTSQPSYSVLVDFLVGERGPLRGICRADRVPITDDIDGVIAEVHGRYRGLALTETDACLLDLAGWEREKQ
ncbi:MAG: hypothetical protein PHU25_01240 [Deltaproteobacteria bacterium]|nr:hypothetical protein [Deltaproteobacteria bacterium]